MHVEDFQSYRFVYWTYQSVLSRICTLKIVFCSQIALVRVTASGLLIYCETSAVLYLAFSRVFSHRWWTTDVVTSAGVTDDSTIYLPTRDECLFGVVYSLYFDSQPDVRYLQPRETVFVGNVITCAFVCCRSTLSTKPGPETLSIHVICQLFRGICWLVPRVCVG